jgi:AAA family ATP:ADP antiporter
MIAQVGRVFSLRRDEVTPATFLFFYLFLVIGAYIMGKSVGDALFLDVFPKHLPYAMIGSALTIGVLISAYIRLSHRLRLELLVVWSLLFFVFSFVVFWWLTRYQYRWVYLLVYVWVYAAGAMGPMMGWTVANFVLTTRAARRVFGFVQLGAILGVPFVAFFTADMMHHGHLRPPTLLLLVAALLGVCVLLIKLLFRDQARRSHTLSLTPSAGQDTPKNFGQSVSLIRNSRYLLLLTALIAIGCLATSILDYQFKLIAKSSFGANTAGLTAYFGRFYGYMGLVTFVFQLALAGPMLRSFGIRVTLFVLPLALMGSSAAVLIVPSLITASILRGSHYILRYSLDKSSTELLYLPVASAVKSQVKSFIDTFVWRSADGIAGIVLLFFATVLKFSPSLISLVNMVILGTWIAVAYGVRREYLNVLRRAIERRTIDPERTVAGMLDSTTTEVLALCLKRGQERQLLYGLSLFETGRGPGSHPALRGLLEHASPAVRVRALRLLSGAGDREILPQVEKMLQDESLEVRTEAMHYLVVQTGRDPLALLSAETNFPDYTVQGSMAAYLARRGEPEDLATAQLLLQGMISRTGDEGPKARVEAARVLGVVPPSSHLHAELSKLLRDESPEVVEQALATVGTIQSREFLPLVIEKLGERRWAGSARSAVVQYGDRAVGTLQDHLQDPSVPLAVRRQIPNVLARIPSPESAAVLARGLFQSDADLRFDVLKALNKLRRRDPALIPSDFDFADLLDAELMGYYRSFQILAAIDPQASTAVARSKSPGSEPMLTRTLRERMDNELERIFRLLALIHPPRDMYNAFVGLTSGCPQLHSNALELLEHLLRPDLYRRLAYGLDPEIALREKLEFAERLCGTSVGSKTEAVRILLHSADAWLRACALHAVGEMELADLKTDLRELAHEGDPMIEETWRWASARLAAVEEREC